MLFVEIRKELMSAHQPCPLPMVVCTIGDCAFQRPVVRPEGYSHHQIIWVTHGAGVFTVEGQRMVLREGEGFFTRAGAPHSYQAVENDFATQWVSFRGAEDLLNYCGVGDWMRFRVSAAMKESLKTLYTQCTGNSTEVSRSAAGYTWLTEWLTELAAPNLTPEQRVQQYMETHCGEPLTLDDIAAQVHMSRFALCHYYTRTQGMTVMEQLRRIRIAKAKQLLRNAYYPVAEVGRLCGFDSPSYFGKQFRAETGHTPAEYRSLHRR